MKMFLCVLLRSVGLGFALVLLDGCYFNSAGHIFDQAFYGALTTTADLRPGDALYCDDGDYYVELPRYRYDVPVKTQYNALKDEEEPKKTLTKKGGSELIQIPEDYALYLMGRQGSPSSPSFMKRIGGDAELIKRRCQKFSIARTPKDSLCHFKYVSPASFGWCCLGVLDWLCVDLPITCLENGLVVGLLMGNGLAKAEATPDTIHMPVIWRVCPYCGGPGCWQCGYNGGAWVDNPYD